MTYGMFISQDLSHLLPKERLTLKLALWMAVIFHYGQRRRSGDEYVHHSMRVSFSLKDQSLECQVGALLHDVLEELSWLTKPLAMLTILLLFGLRVFIIVVALTNWLGDDARYHWQMAWVIRKGYREVLIIKLADKADVIAEPFHQSAKRTESYLRSVQGPFTIFVLASSGYLPEDQCKEISRKLSMLLNDVDGQLDKLFPYDIDVRGFCRQAEPTVYLTGIVPLYRILNDRPYSYKEEK